MRISLSRRHRGESSVIRARISLSRRHRGESSVIRARISLSRRHRGESSVVRARTTSHSSLILCRPCGYPCRSRVNRHSPRGRAASEYVSALIFRVNPVGRIRPRIGIRLREAPPPARLTRARRRRAPVPAPGPPAAADSAHLQPLLGIPVGPLYRRTVLRCSCVNLPKPASGDLPRSGESASRSTEERPLVVGAVSARRASENQLG
jgi:hypothetical protein